MNKLEQFTELPFESIKHFDEQGNELRKSVLRRRPILPSKHVDRNYKTSLISLQKIKELGGTMSEDLPTPFLEILTASISSSY